MSGGRRRTPGTLDWRRIGLVSFLIVLGCTVTATIVAAGLVWYGERNISNVDVETAQPGDIDGDGTVDVEELRDVRNVLVVGSDSREGLTAEERKKLGTGEFAGVRTDTVMIVQLDPTRNGAALLSFPRDLLVTLCDGSEGRINSAFEVGRSSDVGGPTCLVRTVTELTGIPIHHYAQVDFGGFVNIVDTLGGVKMYLEEPIVDADAKVDLDAGCVTLSGAEALGFVRVRKIDSDFGRIARQQRFIRELIDEVTSARVALNVPQLFRLVEAGAKAVETDPSLSLNLMRRIAFSFRDISSSNVDARTVPGFNRVISGAAYVVTDPEPADALFEAFRQGVAAPKDIGKKGPRDVRVADVSPVEVLNATTRAGLAAAAAQALEARGFQIDGTGNADNQKAKFTRIIHPPDQLEEAELLRKLFPDAALVPTADAEGIRVEVGADADADQLLAVQPRPSSGTPDPAPTPDYAGAGGSEHPGC